MKQRLSFVCNNCGTMVTKWQGCCPACGEWNTIEPSLPPPPPSKGTTFGEASLSFSLLYEGENAADTEASTAWIATGVEEFDRVCGQGIVPGSVILVGGEPGIGKSTLLLQMAISLSYRVKVAYISGEEGLSQVRLRAERLGQKDAPLLFASHTSLDAISTFMEGDACPHVLIVDSIQTMTTTALDAIPGSVNQIRACTHTFVRLAKSRKCAIILVGHVTKEGMLAGPKLLEHMVDTVLSFEGERTQPVRLLRAVKNRFGPTDELGVFHMTGSGLKEIQNPSAYFLSSRGQTLEGGCVFVGLEGTRPLLMEIQALVAPCYGVNPRRSVVGWDAARLAMILAVLESKCGLSLSQKEVYLNVVGGLKIQEPAADFAAALALASCVAKKPLPPQTVVFGEIDLSGRIRPVVRAGLRIREALKLGFEHIILPEGGDETEVKGGVRHVYNSVRKALSSFMQERNHK